MCRAVTCRTCGKTTWAGCGQHVDSVMRGVARADRCTCDRSAKAKPAENSKGGLFAGLFQRGR